MNKTFIVILLAVVLLSGLALAGTVDVVKNTKNAQGRNCSEIPNLINNQLGFNTLAVNWLEKQIGGITRVILKVSAQKSIKDGTLTGSYNWKPEYVWEVRPPRRDVVPVNTLAKNWMEGKL